MMLRRDSYLSIVQQHDQARRCARCGLAEAVDAACCWCGTSGGNACCVLYLAAAAAAAAAADKLPCRMAGVSMRPSEAAKLDAAGERAAEEKARASFLLGYRLSSLIVRTKALVAAMPAQIPHVLCCSCSR